MRSILFYIGSVPVRSYGLMLVVGFILGLWRATRVAKRYGIATERVMDACLVALVSGIVGARLLFLLLEVPELGWGVFADALSIWQGGFPSTAAWSLQSVRSRSIAGRRRSSSSIWLTCSHRL